MRIVHRSQNEEIITNTGVKEMQLPFRRA